MLTQPRENRADYSLFGGHYIKHHTECQEKIGNDKKFLTF